MYVIGSDGENGLRMPTNNGQLLLAIMLMQWDAASGGTEAAPVLRTAQRISMGLLNTE